MCKSQQQQEEVKVAEDESQDEQLFTASNHSTESWLIDSGYNKNEQRENMNAKGLYII